MVAIFMLSLSMEGKGVWRRLREYGIFSEGGGCISMEGVEDPVLLGDVDSMRGVGVESKVTMQLDPTKEANGNDEKRQVAGGVPIVGVTSNENFKEVQ